MLQFTQWDVSYTCDLTIKCPFDLPIVARSALLLLISSVMDKIGKLGNINVIGRDVLMDR